MTGPTDPFVTISNQTIYDKLVAVENAVTAITPHADTLKDHEARLRSVERWKYALASSTVAAVASLVIALVQTHT